ncbi:MAG: glycosyltransferase family 2 protein [Verrucomicrobiota bacterium]
MNRNPSLSVVIPVYNGGRDLERCLAAVLSQTYGGDNYEVIVVDNGSTDDSVAIARRHPQVTLLTESERGPYAARNRGIAAARGAVIAFTDPDCIPNRDWIEQLVAAMKDPVVGIVLGRRSLAAVSPTLARLGAYEIAKDEYVLNSRIPTLYYGYTNNMAVRKSVLTALGSFVLRPRGADTIFVRQVVDAYSVDAVRYTPAAVVTHLELTSLAVYYRKIFLYGRHRQANNQITFAAALNTRQRMEIFRRAVRKENLSRLCAAQLLGALFLGAGVWHWASVWSRLRLLFRALPR